MTNDNIGKCGHARCAGGDGTHCYEKGKPMSIYRPTICRTCPNETNHPDIDYCFDCLNRQREDKAYQL